MDEHGIQAQAPVFEFSGGLLCLDFVNTVDDRPSDLPHELLNSYNDLVTWGQQAQVVTSQQAQQLLKEADKHPRQASRVLQRAIELRETLFRIFRRVAEGSSPEEKDLVSLNATLADAMSHACIVSKTGAFTWDWSDDKYKLDRMLWSVVRSAANLLTSDEHEATRVCASNDCDWLFLDTSKNHSRRWCNMKSCGNRAKARRHYDRKKSTL